MDLRALARIDDELDSNEVAALCFLCRDTISKKNLEGVKLFGKLDEKCLLGNHFFLSQLLQTICRADLLSYLETDSRPPEETVAKPLLSNYRVMLYELYQDMTRANLDKMKFLLSDKLGRAQTDKCKTALDLFAEMEKVGLLSNTKLDEVHATLRLVDQRVAEKVQRYMQGMRLVPMNQCIHILCCLCLSDVAPTVITDSQPNNQPSRLSDQYYSMIHNPHGVCVVFNNEKFEGTGMNNRSGTMEDEKLLRTVFTQLGFTVVVHPNLTAEDMKRELKRLGTRNFMADDVLVVCVLSHGGKGCVFGTDGQEVSLGDVTQPFTSRSAPTLAGKPKVFFIQACQGKDYQRGNMPCPPRPPQEEGLIQSRLEEDAGPVYSETVPDQADFLVGMATVPNCKSFRNVKEGSIYIQELCKHLISSARSEEMEDILSILTSVNREVSKGTYNHFKQMPEPKYTLTKKLVFKCV
uniref:Caspase-8 n=1 Tax=Mola mola TaxID=94237 RepID=A0A3Q3WWP2_MOLML